MLIPLPILPGSVHSLKPLVVTFYAFCPNVIAVMCRKFSLLKVASLYWKQNSIFVSFFCTWKGQGESRRWPSSGQLVWGNSLTFLESTVTWYILIISLVSSRVHLYTIIIRIYWVLPIFTFSHIKYTRYLMHIMP